MRVRERVCGLLRSASSPAAAPAARAPPEMLPVEKTRTEIMKPNVSAMSVMKGTESGAAGDVTTVAVPFKDGHVMDVVEVGACQAAQCAARATQRPLACVNSQQARRQTQRTPSRRPQKLPSRRTRQGRPAQRTEESPGGAVAARVGSDAGIDEQTRHTWRNFLDVSSRCQPALMPDLNVVKPESTTIDFFLNLEKAPPKDRVRATPPSPSPSASVAVLAAQRATAKWLSRAAAGDFTSGGRRLGRHADATLNFEVEARLTFAAKLHLLHKFTRRHRRRQGFRGEGVGDFLAEGEARSRRRIHPDDFRSTTDAAADHRAPLETRPVSNGAYILHKGGGNARRAASPQLEGECAATEQAFRRRMRRTSVSSPSESELYLEPLKSKWSKPRHCTSCLVIAASSAAATSHGGLQRDCARYPDPLGRGARKLGSIETSPRHVGC